MARVQLAREVVEQVVDERGLARERLGQRIERGRARGQLLAVARELEVPGDAIADHVGEVVDIEAREVARAVRGPEPAERPAERVLVVGARTGVDRLEPRALGQQLAADDPQRQARIAALEEPDHRVDGADVRLAVLEEVGDRRRHVLGLAVGVLGVGVRARGVASVLAILAGVLAVIAVFAVVAALALLGDPRAQLVEDPLDPGLAEQAQEQLDRGVRLRDLEPEPGLVLAEEAGEVSRRRVRRVQLRHRRRDQEQAHRAAR